MRAIEHRDLVELDVLAAQALDAIRDRVRLFGCALRAEHEQRLAFLVVGAQPLVLAQLVVGDHRLRRAQDHRAAAVVLLESHDLRVCVVVLEVEDVADLRAAEAIDRLVRIADDADVAVGRRKLAQQVVLHAVGVLELVDEDPREAFAILLGDGRVLLQQLQEVEQQVVEVHRAELLHALVVWPPHLLDDARGIVAAGSEILRRQSGVLQLRDQRANSARLDLRAIEAEVFEQ